MYIIIEYTYIRVHKKYACGTDTQLPASVLENSGLATSVGSVFGKPEPHTRPSCYVYCLHHARNGQNLVELPLRVLLPIVVELTFLLKALEVGIHD